MCYDSELTTYCDLSGLTFLYAHGYEHFWLDILKQRKRESLFFVYIASLKEYLFAPTITLFINNHVNNVFA